MRSVYPQISQIAQILGLIPHLSFPRRRESTDTLKMDSRFRGNDKLGRLLLFLTLIFLIGCGQETAVTVEIIRPDFVNKGRVHNP